VCRGTRELHSMESLIETMPLGVSDVGNLGMAESR
jgi:hypothetical protein